LIRRDQALSLESPDGYRKSGVWGDSFVDNREIAGEVDPARGKALLDPGGGWIPLDRVARLKHEKIRGRVHSAGEAK